MSNVTKLFQDKPMTKKELDLLSKRVDELSAAIDLTDEEDILDNYERELEQIKMILTKSIERTKLYERIGE